MSEPVIENASVLLYLPTVWQGDVFAFLVNPVVDGAESEALVLFEEFDEIGNERRLAESVAKATIKVAWAQVLGDAKGYKVVRRASDLLGGKPAWRRIKIERG